MGTILILILILPGIYIHTGHAQPGTSVINGERRLWHPIEVVFDGPRACEGWVGGPDSAQFNPFRHRRLLVTFTNGSTSHTVPGFFNGNGQAAFSTERTPDNECGIKWAVRFVPDRTGTWTYTVSFRRGADVAIKTSPTAGTPDGFNGASGSFTVAASNKTGDDFRSKGILRYVGEHYPRFGNGEYYIKTGTDSPENFLGYDQFHNTFRHETRFQDSLLDYSTHLDDYDQNPGILWGANRDTGREIYGALNYLNSIGVNSVYMITYGIDGGDSGAVWAWTCPNALVPDCEEDKHTFDISKLEQWELVFRHMDELGMQLHFVFTEQENDRSLTDSEWQLYFREMIARFGAHNAVKWNLGEENYWMSASSDEERWSWQRQQAAYIREVDPFNHRITAHSINREADTYYEGLFGAPYFEATSIQGESVNFNDYAVNLRQRSADNGRPWIIYADEQFDRVDEDLGNWGRLRDLALWGNLMGGGGGVQWYVEYQQIPFTDVNLDNFRSLEPVYQDSTIAREFFENHLPRYWHYEPANDLVTASDGNAYAFVEHGNYYALYFEEAFSNKTLDLTGTSGLYRVVWYSPRTGRAENGGAVVGGGVVTLDSPPFTESARFNGDSTDDYAALVYRSGIDGTVTPVDVMYVINRIGQPVNASNAAADVDGNGRIEAADADILIEQLGR
ncbi:MAG: DUF5060 domain-containing protein [Chloroflexota bacterium]